MFHLSRRQIYIVTTCVFCISLASVSNANDTEIRDWVTNALRHDQRVDSKHITVSAKDGIVTLTGQVPTLASGWFAVHEAQKIHGVIGTTNKLTVAKEDREDAEVIHDIEQRIASDVSIVSRGLHVGCLDGFVTLSGEVAEYTEELEAELIASEVRGVRQVQNHLLTAFIRKFDDRQTQQDVAAMLARDVYLTQTPVTAIAKESVVTLTGNVGSAYAKRRAEDQVRKIEHVKSVDNQLIVDPSLTHGEKKKFVWPTEEALEAALKTELLHDSRVDAGKIDVTVEYGHVVLDGIARTHREKQIAEADAWGIIGVDSVTNNLVINGPERGDSLIQDDAAISLASDAMLHDYNLHAASKLGTLTLSGDVDTQYERAHAEDLIGRIRGVLSIDNKISVDRGTQYNDETLASEIASRWKQNKETHDCQLIEVEVVNGVAVLTGNVESWAEHQEAARVAFHTDGIWKVENNLIVEGFDYPWEEFREEGNRNFDPADPSIHQFLFG